MDIKSINEIENLIENKDFITAAARLDVALSARPDDSSALLFKSEIELFSENNALARQFLERALTGHIDSPRTCLRLLRILSELSESGLMIQVCAQIPPNFWDSAASLSQVSHLLTGAGAYNEALKFAEAGVLRDDSHPPSLYALATLRTFFGDIGAAAELCGRVLKLIPNDPGAWWLLSRLRQPEPGKRIDQLKSLTIQYPDSDSTIWLNYALHNELHELGEFDAAWSALDSACRKKRLQVHTSKLNQLRLFEALMSVDDWGTHPLAERNSETICPIFIIGLHRSGTTLVEQILAGHSLVAPGGETYDIRAQLRRASKIHFSFELDQRLVDCRNDLNYEAIGRNFCRGLSWRSQGKRFVTDKLPSNYFNLGFIARALPDSKFICLARDPIDVGFSSLRTLFSHAAPYSYSQLDFINHQRAFNQLMHYWRRQFPSRILDVNYHDLTSAPELTAKRMTSFLKLSYEPAMVAVSSRTGPVATASSVMVRDGIRNDRGKVWMPYSRYLSQLISEYP